MTESVIMQEEVLRKPEPLPSLVYIPSREHESVAKTLKTADIDNDNKLSAPELTTLMVGLLPVESRKQMHMECSEKQYQAIGAFIRDMRVSAKIAVDKGWLDEVAIPSIQRICSRVAPSI